MILVYKPEGITMGQLAQKVKNYLRAQKVTYAGTLDPCASGLTIFLSDDEVYQKETFNKLDKTYTFQIIYGISTDTHDMFGIPTNTQKPPIAPISQEQLKSLIGTFNWEYPKYSYKKVQGKPLWAHKEHIELPKRPMTIHSIKLISQQNISKSQILKRLEFFVKTIKGDFRHNQILNSWNKISADLPDQLSLQTIQCSVSSGTYIRTITQQIGKLTNTPTLAYSIKRTGIGHYNLSQSVKID